MNLHRRFIAMNLQNRFILYETLKSFVAMIFLWKIILYEIPSRNFVAMILLCKIILFESFAFVAMIFSENHIKITEHQAISQGIQSSLPALCEHRQDLNFLICQLILLLCSLLPQQDFLHSLSCSPFPLRSLYRA